MWNSDFKINFKKVNYIFMFMCMNVFNNIGKNKILCEVAATINERGDEHYFFRPCWLQPPGVVSYMQFYHSLQPNELESNHSITMTETTHQQQSH